MKITIVLLALVGLVAAASVHSSGNQVTVADHAFLQKQKFLLEIVYRVEDPLMFEEYIQLGHSLVYDKAHYTHFDNHMERFYQAYKMGAILPQGEYFGALVKTHYKQVLGLFNFFYYANDWATFQQNVAWARIHVNEGMFVYALTLAVIHRDDFQGLMLPSIHEIFPQQFFNSRLILNAEKFDYNTWAKNVQYEKELNDVYHNNNQHHYYNNDYFYAKDFKTYQWWVLMGLTENWHAMEKSFPLRENSYQFVSNEKYVNLMKDIHMFWHPVDYTRNIENFNEHSQLSYFTEDLGWNAYWYYLNLDYAFWLDGETFGLNKDRRGEWWIHNVNQILARYYMERLSHGLGEIPEISWTQSQPFEHGYDSELISWNGVGYSYRKNYYEIQSYGNYDMLNQVQNALQRIQQIIDWGYYMTADGHKIDMRQPEAIEYIGNYMQGNIDVFDKYFLNYWYMLAQMYLSHVDYHDFTVNPSVLLNWETMLRDPIFYSMHKQISNVFSHFYHFIQPYTHEELSVAGVEIQDAEVSELVTYFDLVDFDVTNLLNDKMVIADGEFVWDKSLYARQMRLNHKPFNYNIKVKSETPQKVVVRAFYGPKFDEHGEIISIQENHMNFVELDEFVHELTAGENVIKRSSEDFLWTVKDRTTYTELYQYVMAAFDGKYELPLDISEPHCGFPDRLILPKGWASGMPMQFVFFISEYESSVQQHSNYDPSYYCGIGSGTRHIDNRPFGYPFNRHIDLNEFFVPNIYFKDVSIHHQNTFRQYSEGYNNYGHFDYNFYNNYWTQWFH